MNKLFSLFIKYSLLPEKQFLKRSSQTIYSLAELAEKTSPALKVQSKPDSLKIYYNRKNINITVEPELRQIFYTSSISGTKRYSPVGSRWLSNDDQDLQENLKQELLLIK